MVINSPWMLSKNWLVQMQTNFGVNTPRSDEDRFKLMELMVFLMKNGVCDEFGLNAARLFKFLLSGKVSAVWTSLFADSHNMVAILEKSDAAEGFEQIINFLSGSYINHALTMNPHVFISCIKQFWNTTVVKRSGLVCLSNEEIFAGLARIGYEKPSTKLTFYKAFFSTQWKFFIHMILHSLSAKRTSWNEFSSAVASALICLSSVDQEKDAEVERRHADKQAEIYNIDLDHSSKVL
nr:hypothetical protein [Tanacetum cinerariifolium]